MLGCFFQTIFRSFLERKGTHMGNSQSDIQIPHSHITIDAKNCFTAFCKGLGNAGAKACFTCATLTGYDCDQFAHSLVPLLTD